MLKPTLARQLCAMASFQDLVCLDNYTQTKAKTLESKLIHELCLLAGIEKSKTTSFHPISDGQAERLNRTLLQMLRTTANDHVHNWPSFLPTVLSAYRITIHSVTGITPYVYKIEFKFKCIHGMDAG